MNAPRVSRPTPAHRFYAGARSASAPLAVWAVHFAFSYVLIASFCSGAVWPTLGADGLRVVLLAGTGVALAVLAALCRWPRSHDGLPPRVRRLSALLSAIAVLWTAVPMALLPTCG